MNELLEKRLGSVFDLTTDLAVLLHEKQYTKKIAGAGSNTIGEQICSIVGTRESYARQIEKGGSLERACSVDDQHNKLQVMKALHESAMNLIRCPATDRTGEVLLKVLEYEVQCHGRLIAWAEVHKIQLPDSWSTHYVL